VNERGPYLSRNTRRGLISLAIRSVPVDEHEIMAIRWIVAHCTETGGNPLSFPEQGPRTEAPLVSPCHRVAGGSPLPPAARQGAKETTP
jgi:hypothetical protein